MDKAEYESIEKNANYLQDSADRKMNLEIKKAQEYGSGYKQGIEDLLTSIRRPKQI